MQCCKVASVRLATKELIRSPLVGDSTQDGTYMPQMCPTAIWHAVAPSLVQGGIRNPDGSIDSGTGVEAPCISRAEKVRASLEEAIDLKPELEASKVRAAGLVSIEHSGCSGCICRVGSPNAEGGH